MRKKFAGVESGNAVGMDVQMSGGVPNRAHGVHRERVDVVGTLWATFWRGKSRPSSTIELKNKLKLLFFGIFLFFIYIFKIIANFLCNLVGKVLFDTHLVQNKLLWFNDIKPRAV